MFYVGDFSPGSTVYIYFNTFDSNDPSASVTITNFINTDVHIHKDDSLTQRNNAAGITVDVDVDAITGSHFISIDTADNTVADFFTAGHDYFVRIEGTTVDAATINAVVGHFSLDNRMVAGKMVSTDIATLASQTSFTLDTGSADNDAYIGCTAIISDLASGIQKCYGLISAYTGASRTVTLVEDPGIFTMAAGDNITIIAASALSNVKTVGGVAASTQIQSDVQTVVETNNLDHLCKIADSDDVVDDSIIAKLASKGATADWSDFDNTSDSLEAIADSVAVTSGARYAPDASSVITTGTQDANTYAACAVEDGVKWTIGDSNGANTIDVVCEMNMGESRIAYELNVNGYYNRSGGGGYKVLLYAWNYVTSAWDALQAGTVNLEMRDRSSDKDYVWALNAEYTDPTVTPGEVKINFRSTRPTTQNGDVLYLDYVSIVGQASASISPQAVALAVHEELDSHLKHIPCFTGEIHYVSKSGDDSNSGHTPDNAFLTVAAGIAETSSGDRLVIKAGTYDENGLALTLDGMEIICEIGTIFQNSTPGTVLTVSGDACIVEDLLIEPTAGEIGIVVSGNYCRILNTYPHVAGATAWSITGEHNVFERCRADNYTVTGFNVTEAENVFTQCIAYGAGATRGFYFSHTDAHENLMNNCTTINNDTGGIEFVSGADLNSVQDHISTGETTPYTDNGSNNTIVINTDYADVNTIQVEGVDATDQITTACTSSLNTYDGPTNAEMEARTIVAADYFDPANDTVANVTTVATTTDVTNDVGITAAAVDAVWDEVLTGATHNTPTSAGRRLREIAGSVIVTGTSPDTGGTANTAIRIELDGDASATNGAYDPAVINIVEGTGAGQSRQIFEYDGTNKYAYINRDWKVIPDNTSEYIITANSGDGHTNEGLATAGSANEITLNSLASAVNDTYVGQIAVLTAGTGQDQARRISGYNGSTKVATVERNWDTNPDNGTIYFINQLDTCSHTTIDDILVDTGTTLPAQITSVHGTTDGLIGALNDFDPANDAVASVTLVGTTTTNTDMRGTDNAATAAALSTHDGKLDTVDTNVDAILVDTGTTLPAQISALNDITVAEIIAGVADGSYDLQEMLRIIFSACAGKTNTNGTIFRDSGDTKNRITATLDANKNRTAMTLDGS